MKTRTGFVSNSSSSSFIIGVGLVTDKFAFDIAYPDHKKLPDYMELHTIGELKETCKRWGVHVTNNEDGSIKYVEVESFDGSSVCTNDLSSCADTDYILVYSGGGSISEDELWNDVYEEYDYDVDYDMFDSEEKEAMDLISGPLVQGAYTYGAGRNG